MAPLLTSQSSTISLQIHSATYSRVRPGCICPSAGLFATTASKTYESEFRTQPSLWNRLCFLLLPSAVSSPNSAEKTVKPLGKEVKPMFEVEPHIWGKSAIGSEKPNALEQLWGFCHVEICSNFWCAMSGNGCDAWAVYRLDVVQGCRKKTTHEPRGLQALGSLHQILHCSCNSLKGFQHRKYGYIQEISESNKFEPHYFHP